jgi:DNA primase
LSYPEALVKLAGIQGVPIEYEDRKKSPEQIAQEAERRQKRESLYLLNKAVWEYWKQTTPNPFPAIFSDVETKQIYLDVWGRSYKESTVQRFGLTIAPDENAITKTYKAAGWNHENLLHLALIKPSEKAGGEYDTFRGRLIFPIYHNDKPDYPAGFAGRIHPDIKDENPKGASRPKYLNSSESDLYQKRKVLFGLPQNRTAITKAGLAGQVFIVEGYTDVLTMVDNGIENVVGKSGTALTLEQCEMLKRYAKEVIVLGDGDAAGQKASLSDVETLVKAGLSVKVLVLPTGTDGKKEDPDSWIRKYGNSGFLALSEHPTEGLQDGILWHIRHELGEKPDVHRREMALDKAAEILSGLSSFKREDYLKTLTKVGYFNCHKKEIESRILDKETNREKHSGDWRELSGEQERDLQKYGIYAGKPGPRKSEVYLKNGDFPEPLSNFVFKPIYHIYSSSNPGRKVEIVNEEGTSYILTLHTNCFTSLDKMQAEVAAYGNFIFTGNCRKADFINITRRLYDQMETVFGISMLGFHNAGFYTWANGVSLEDGTFKAANETGRINHDERNFVVPGFDVEEKQKAYSDEGHNVDAHIKLFSYFPGDTFTMEKWIKSMVKVYGDKGRVLVAWYIAAVYRDLIYPSRHKGFPILFCFGPPQKGKSTAIWSLNALFGKPRPPLNVNNVTSYGLSVRHTQSRNALVSITEYKNAVEMFKIEILKSQYDGVGRERGSTEKRNSSEQTPVHNAVSIDGQNLPLKDPALYTRSIPVEFNGYDNSAETTAIYQAMKKEEDSGRLSQLTSGLMKYRKQVDERLDRHLDAALGEVRQWVGDIKEDRILINHCILLAVVRSLEDVIAFPEREDVPGISFYEALKGWCCDSIKRQFANLDAESETGDFFRSVMNLTLRAQIRHGIHIIVQEGNSVAVWDEFSGKTLETERTTFASPHKFLFFNLDRVQSVYAKDFKERTGQIAMSVTELKSYLEQAKGFLGIVKAKKFPRDNSTLSAYVFDLGEIQLDGTNVGGLAAQGVDLPLSKIVIARENQAQSETGNMDGELPNETPKTGYDVPFEPTKVITKHIEGATTEDLPF